MNNTESDNGGSLERVVRRRRMTHAQAVTEEFKRWRFDYGQDALVLAFCARVGERMKGRDMDDVLSPPNDEGQR